MKTKFNFKKVASWILTLSLVFSFTTFISPSSVVFAKNHNGAKATEFAINIIKNGQTTLVHQYSIDEMKKLQTVTPVYYSSIDSMPAPVTTKAQGVLLSTLLKDVAMKYGSSVTDYSAIKLFTTDSNGQAFTTIDRSYLDTERYYFPNLVSTWDRVNNKPGNGATDNAVPVEPIFTLTSYQGRNLTEAQLDTYTMDDLNTFRFCFGQTEDDITNATVTTNKFAKWVNRIDIVLP